MTALPHELNERLAGLEARIRRVEDHLKLQEQVAPAALAHAAGTGEPAAGVALGQSSSSEELNELTGADAPIVPETTSLEVAHTQDGAAHHPVLPPPLPVTPPAAAPVPPLAETLRAAAANARARAAMKIGHGLDPQADPASGRSQASRVSAEPSPLSSWDIESLIGGRWYAIAGALAVVLGIVLFLKLGFDRGWFDMAPAVKCSIAAFFGCVLVACGEVLRRRVSSAAATGAFAAGLGVVYASVYAAFRLYGLLPDSVAFALLGLTAVGGIAISALAKLPVIAIVSLIGGYLAPFLFADSPARPVVMPAYLTMLLLIGLGISAAQGKAFTHVRSLVRVATLLLGGLWFFQQGRDVPTTAVSFSIFVWVTYHVELLWSSVRREIDAQPLGSISDSLTLDHWHQWSPLASTFSVTAWSCVIGVLALRDWGATDWLSPAAYFASTATIGWFLAGHLDCFRVTPSNSRERLGAMMHVQAAALLLITIALLLGGWAQITAWLIMACAAAVAGNLLRSRVFHVYALAPMLICTGRLLAYDSTFGSLSKHAATWMGMDISMWTVLMCLAGAAWCVNALIFLRYGGQRTGQASGAWANTADASTLVGIALAGIAFGHAAPNFWLRGWIVLSCAALCWIWSSLTARRQVGAVSEVVATLALLCALASAWWNHRSGAIEVAGLYLTPYATLPLGIACMLGLRAVVRALDSTHSRLADALLASGMLVLAFTPVHTQAQISSVLIIWSLLALAAAALRGTLGRFQPLFGIVPIMLLSLCVWSVRYLGDSWSTGGFVSGLIISAVLGLIPTVLSLREPLVHQESTRRAFAGVAAILLLVNTSMQVAQTASRLVDDVTIRAAAISVWWGIFALGLIVLGFFRKLPLLRHAGLALLAVAAAKGLIVDLWSASAIWRIMSLVLLGLMMIGVAAGYQKIIRSLGQRSSHDLEQESSV